MSVRLRGSWVGFLSSHGVLRQVRRTIPWFDTYPIRLPDAPSSHVNFDMRELFQGQIPYRLPGESALSERKVFPAKSLHLLLRKDFRPRKAVKL